jgi:hypothetical protein
VARRGKLLFWGLVAASAVLAAWLGASADFTRPAIPSPLFYVAFGPGLVAVRAASVVDAIRHEREARAKFSTSGLPYRGGWSSLFMRTIVAPLGLGVLASVVEVCSVALAVHAIFR